MESLLAVGDEAGNFLSRPATLEVSAPSLAGAPSRLPIGTRLGPYEVVSFLGAGGAGGETGTAGTGTGLSNVRERLAGVYGDRHRLEATIADGRGAEVRLERPVTTTSPRV